MFVHEDRDFDDLLRIVADEHGLAIGLVEKDYWVTHALWSLLNQGFEVWFKGGTSLSKGFGLIERFSEDLDLNVSPGRVAALPEVSDWMREGAGITAERRCYFETLATMLEVPAASRRSSRHWPIARGVAPASASPTPAGTSMTSGCSVRLSCSRWAAHGSLHMWSET